jgi:hypothetical protein
MLTSAYFDLLKYNKVDAYNIVDSFIPRLIQDLKGAHKQNNVLKRSEVVTLDELSNFAKRHVNGLNSPHGTVLIST